MPANEYLVSLLAVCLTNNGLIIITYIVSDICSRQDPNTLFQDAGLDPTGFAVP